jgi:hypothetical protein
LGRDTIPCMTDETANPDAVTALGEDVVAMLGRLGHVFDGPLGQTDRSRAEIEMIQQDIMAGLNLPKSIRDTPTGDKMLLTLLRGKLLAASDVAFGSNGTRC